MKRIVYVDTDSFKIERLLRSSSVKHVFLQRAENEVDIQRILDNHTVALVILPGDRQSPSFSLADIPVLFCCFNNEDYPEMPATQFELVDYLYPPINTAKLYAKISFLLKVRELSLKLRQSTDENAALRKQIHELHQSVEGHNTFLDLMSRRDGLTGLFNRRQFNTLIEQYYNRAAAKESDLALIVLNIDYFNEINRTCGQVFGDYVLNDLAARITSCSEQTDKCFRLSGEDFAILMPQNSTEQAMEKAEELRLFCAGKPYEKSGLRRNISISAGIASLKSHRPRSHEDLINMAHHALFMAKTEGRNRCALYVAPHRGSGSTTRHHAFLKDNVKRILEKSKTSTLRSLQLLAHGLVDTDEALQLHRAKEYVELLSKELFFPSSFVDTFQNSFILLSSIRCLLHSDMLGKAETLSNAEWKTLTDLPYKLAEIADVFDYFSEEKILLLHYGEKYDGSGYPQGLKGEEIPIGARILHLISAFAAMNSNRPYRKQLQPGDIVAELAENAGKQFDPCLVLKLFDVIEEKGILEIDSGDLDNSRKKIEKSIRQ